MYVAHTRIYTISNKFEPPGINNGNQKKPETVVDIMTSEITHFFSNSKFKLADDNSSTCTCTFATEKSVTCTGTCANEIIPNR
jgi:hypothetical protein